MKLLLGLNFDLNSHLFYLHHWSLWIKHHHEKPYQNNLGEANQLITFFLNNWKRYIGTEHESFFLDAIFNLKKVPKEKAAILNSLQGKMNRDILKQVDVNNVLGII